MGVTNNLGSGVRVLGVDAWKGRWFGAVLDGSDIQFLVEDALEDLIGASEDVAAVVVDIPIGLPGADGRLADKEARRFVGPRGSSVFSVPGLAALRADSYSEALAISRRGTGVGLSTQAYALRRMILDASEVCSADDRILEGHPEVTFAAMKGSTLDFAKRTWNGFNERRWLLAAEGLIIPDDLGLAAGKTGLDDVLDAAAMAWSALRVAHGDARSLPDPPERIAGRQVAIWY